jgi:CubicO group peptidase (beta-lactamase class C family)
MGADSESALESFLEQWVESGEVTAAFAAVATRERVLWSGGAAADRPTPTARSLFDAASLTKPWMATLALRLDAEGALPLSTTLEEVWPDAAPAMAAIPLRALLEHRAGFAAWTPLYRRCRTREDAERLLLSGALLDDDGRDDEGAARRGRRPARGGASAAPGSGLRAARSRERLGGSTRASRGVAARSASEPPARAASTTRYSDLDFVTWGFAVERRLGAELWTLLRRFLLEPMRIDGVEVSPGPRADVVPCRCDNAREVELAARQRLRVPLHGGPAVGEPQDGNARFLGGLAGHAGLFVSAEASIAFGRAWLAALDGSQPLLPRIAARAAVSGRREYALGWARRRIDGAAGRALGSAAFGHIGFTGGSLWIDPTAGTIHLLLAHRRDVESRLNAARHRFHALAAELAR